MSEVRGSLKVQQLLLWKFNQGDVDPLDHLPIWVGCSAFCELRGCDCGVEGEEGDAEGGQSLWASIEAR